ncbi:MAG: peptidyl-prolyl cis-trans isomerase [Eubacterium sp.]|nr:peptidyl-prolyl cis-trans isomerase [Eubacterium sp.]
MNNAKKIIKEQGLQKPDKKEVKAKQKSRKNLILIIIGAIVILGGVFVVCYTQLRPRPVLVVDGPGADGDNSNITLNYTDTMYDIFQMESMYNQYGVDWDQDSGTGSTMADSAKNQVMDDLKQRIVLYMQAQKEGTTLDETETGEVDTAVQEAMNNINENSNGAKGLSESYVRTSIEQQKLADKHKQKIIDGFTVDEDAIRAEISKEDFRQYTLQYYLVSKKGEAPDDGSEAPDKDADTLAKDKANLEELQKKAKKADDFSTLINDSDGDSKDDETGILFGSKNLIETDEDFGDEAFRKKIKSMNNGDVSDVMETDDAYYVFKMVNNDDPAAFESEVSSKLESEKNTDFNNYYNDTLLKMYNIQVTSYWKNRVQFGAITTK